jgi:hypothetical protein
LGDNSFEGTSIIREKFIPYLKVSKLCETSNCSDTGTPTAGIILSNGSVITFQRRINSAGCTHTRLIAGTSVPICAVINVNTNGFKPPNKSGEDIFQFWMTPNSIIPTGLQGDSEFDYCKRGIDGYGCAAWVIYNENMDYLHCNDLSWEGKTKCN